jgi:hypothetical protein
VSAIDDLRFWIRAQALVAGLQNWLFEVGDVHAFAAAMQAFGGFHDAVPNVVHRAGWATVRLQKANDWGQDHRSRCLHERSVSPLPASGFELVEVASVNVRKIKRGRRYQIISYFCIWF